MIMPSGKDLKKIRDCVMFPFLIHVLDRDKEIIARSPIKLKETYAQIFEYVSHRAFKEMVAAYDELKLMKVKIYEQQRDKEGLRIRYLWKGYHNDTYYRWVDMKEDIKNKILDYFIKEQKESLYK